MKSHYVIRFPFLAFERSTEVEARKADFETELVLEFYAFYLH